MNLISLGIPSASSVQTLEPLAGKALTHLNISGCKGILDFSAVTSLSSLSKLEVKDVALWNAFASSIDLSDTLDVEV